MSGSLRKDRTVPPPEAVVLPPIPTGRYTDPEFHELDRDRIFARTWLFAGQSRSGPNRAPTA